MGFGWQSKWGWNGGRLVHMSTHAPLVVAKNTGREHRQSGIAKQPKLTAKVPEVGREQPPEKLTVNARSD